MSTGTSSASWAAPNAQVQLDPKHFWSAAPDVLLVASPTGELLNVNSAFTHALGWSDLEATSTSLLELGHPSQRRELLEALATLATGKPWAGFELLSRHKDGSYRWLSWSAAVDGQLLYLIGRMIFNRSDVPSPETLAEEWSAAGRLTRRIVHDINNQLTGVLFSLDLLGRRLAAEHKYTLQPLLDLATTAANRAVYLTSHMQALARNQTLQAAPIEPTQLAALMEQAAKHCLDEEKITHRVLLPSGLWTAEADRKPLEHALSNLLRNAAEAMPAGGQVILEASNVHLHTHPALVPGDYVVICVSDTGAGMPPSISKHAFEPFFSKKDSEHAGLGLTVVERFAKKSKGHLSLGSAPGQGTTAQLFIPRFVGERAAKQDK